MLLIVKVLRYNFCYSLRFVKRNSNLWTSLARDLSLGTSIERAFMEPYKLNQLESKKSEMLQNNTKDKKSNTAQLRKCSLLYKSIGCLVPACGRLQERDFWQLKILMDAIFKPSGQIKVRSPLQAMLCGLLAGAAGMWRRRLFQKLLFKYIWVSLLVSTNELFHSRAPCVRLM